MDKTETEADNTIQAEAKPTIPVHISVFRNEKTISKPRREPVRKTIRRHNDILQSLELPVILNINPRSLYNKTDEFSELIEQYSADLITISESWEREERTLEELLQLENYKVITNVKQRDFRGGKPAILINEEKFYVKTLCPDPITVPVGVECVWALITPKNTAPNSKVKYIAVASVYYRGPKSTKKGELFDHIAQTFHFLSSKYGSNIHFVIAGDTNRLNLSPITNLSPNLKQEVKVYTRLNPPAILDPIITTLGKWYQSPVTKPPINPNKDGGKPSDHLIVLMMPLVSALQHPPRVYTSVVTRPLTQAGMQKFASWVEKYEFSEIYECKDGHRMAEIFQELLLNNFHRCFPTKILKVCAEDKPWVSAELKKLHRSVQREYLKHKQSEKWKELNQKFIEKCSYEKEKYYQNMVSDLKLSNPGKWYSKVKRMTGKTGGQENILVDELIGLSSKQQAERIAEHYSDISNNYDQIQEQDFPEYLNPLQYRGRSDYIPPSIEPLKVYQTIRKMNKKAATVENDIPIKLLDEFSVELAFPLSHIISFCIREGIYPNIWKLENVTPLPKVFPPEKLQDLRKISGLLNCSKIADKIIGEMIIQDMEPTRDPSQYGNQKKVSAQHYLIKMLHQILRAVDKNSQNEAIAVLVNLVDWSQAFDRQSHKLGVQSFIKNGVRPSLIPILISFFQNRKMKVKWNKESSSIYTLNGGGPQGGLLGILEYLSQTNDNTDFLDEDDKFKFIDDLSILEIINLISQGLATHNFKFQVASDIDIEHNQFLPQSSIKSQNYLDRLENWTNSNLMKLNADKSKFMIVNFTEKYQFNTRLTLENKQLEQVNETRLLGVVINDKLTWHSNTEFIVKKAYKRMVILHNLFDFGLPVSEMVNIYILYIRSILETSAVVWHSSITQAETSEIERVQKVALRIILGGEYEDYKKALNISGLQTLSDRRIALCKQFAKNCTKSSKMSHIFPLNQHTVNTRNPEKYFVSPASTGRLANSAIPYMQRLLNVM